MRIIDVTRNKLQQITGRIKQNIGRNTGNRRLQAEGVADRTKGSAKQTGERVKRSFRK
ncbi:MAG: CsbD family protein [Acidimicrobiia bacterium]